METNKNDIHKIIIDEVRKSMVDDGFFDGRYKTKSVPNKKKYSRKKKHKKKDS